MFQFKMKTDECDLKDYTRSVFFTANLVYRDLQITLNLWFKMNVGGNVNRKVNNRAKVKMVRLKIKKN